MKLGTLTPSFRLGGNTPSRIYRGSNLVFLNPLSLSPALWLSDTGSDLAQWEDLSGNGRHAVQATPANRPSIVTGALNGRQVRRFDGGDSMANVASLASTSLTMMTVGYRSGASTNGVFVHVGSDSTKLGVGLSIHSTGARKAYIYGSTEILGTATNSASVMTSMHSAGSQSFYINGTLIGSGVTSGVSCGAGYSVGALRSGSSTRLNGDIAEILVFPTALSTADRQAVETYLNAKWAIY